MALHDRQKPSEMFKMVKDADNNNNKMVFSKWTQPSTCSDIVLLIHLVISVTVKMLLFNI